MGKDPWCLSPQFTAVKRGAGRFVGVGRYRWGFLVSFRFHRNLPQLGGEGKNGGGG